MVDLDRDERAAFLSWASFTVTFAGVRTLTHWIRSGHGPRGGGMRLGGHHFHHYNIGIALLSGLAGYSLRRGVEPGSGPLRPVVFGFANALIADEAALLLDLEDVYWLPQGRVSVDLAAATIGVGGLAVAAQPLAVALRARAHTR